MLKLLITAIRAIQKDHRLSVPIKKLFSQRTTSFCPKKQKGVICAKEGDNYFIIIITVFNVYQEFNTESIGDVRLRFLCDVIFTAKKAYVQCVIL